MTHAELATLSPMDSSSEMGKPRSWRQALRSVTIIHMHDSALRIMLKLIICNSRDVIAVKVLDNLLQWYVASFHVEKVNDDEFETQEAAVEDIIPPAKAIKCLYSYA